MYMEMLYVSTIALSMGRGKWTHTVARVLYFPEVTEY